MNESSAIFEIIHATLQDPTADNLSVAEMCHIAGVSRSGYYAWVKAEPIRLAQEEQDRADFDLILEAYKYRGYAKGARGIYMRLLHMDPPIFILCFSLVNSFFLSFSKFIDELFVYVIPLGPLFHGLSGIRSTRNKTSSYIAMIGLLFSPVPYGSPTSHVIRDILI